MTVMETQPRVRRWGPATSQLVRRLAVDAEPINQVALARDLQVSQPRISQILRLLANHEIDIEHLDDPEQRRRLVDLYVRYHRPYAVSESLFYGLDPVYEQVRLVIEAASRQDVRVTVSADLAPDLVAPWRTPTLTVVYAEAPLNLEPSLFVPAMARGEATLLIRHVSDDSLLDPWPTSRPDIPIVHPVQQVWDLYDLGGEDRIEAAQRLIDRTLR
jgi:hypothetical protein